MVAPAVQAAKCGCGVVPVWSRIVLMSYTCAKAKLAMPKIFLRFPRPPFTPGAPLKGGPAGFVCRSRGAAKFAETYKNLGQRVKAKVGKNDDD